MLDGERGIGMLAFGKQAETAQIRYRALPREQHEQLIADHGAAGGEAPFVELCARADMGQQRSDVDGALALARDLDVIDLRLIADHELKRGVDLIVRSDRGPRGSR